MHSAALALKGLRFPVRPFILPRARWQNRPGSLGGRSPPQIRVPGGMETVRGGCGHKQRCTEGIRGEVGTRKGPRLRWPGSTAPVSTFGVQHLTCNPATPAPSIGSQPDRPYPRDCRGVPRGERFSISGRSSSGYPASVVRARVHGIDGDAALDELLRQRRYGLDQRTLRRRISDLVRHGLEMLAGAGKDDSPALALPAVSSPSPARAGASHARSLRSVGQESRS